MKAKKTTTKKKPTACPHPSLNLSKIKVAQRCPDCLKFVDSAGNLYESTQDVIKKRKKSEPPQGLIDEASDEMFCERPLRHSEVTTEETEDTIWQLGTSTEPIDKDDPLRRVNSLIELVSDPRAADTKLKPLMSKWREVGYRGQLKPFIPSPEQVDVFKWYIGGQGNLIIKGVAGCGKTTVLERLAQVIKYFTPKGRQVSALFCAFGRDIAAELRTRLQGLMECRTIHSIGNEILRQEIGRLDLQNWKYSNIMFPDIKRIVSNIRTSSLNKIGIPTEFEVRNAADDLLEYIQVTLTDPDDLESVAMLIDHFGLDIPSLTGKFEDDLNLMLSIVTRALDEGEQLARNEGTITYTDMIYLPVKWKLEPVSRYKDILVDEVQDLNRLQLELLLKIRAKGCRMTVVGDPNQAIYGFSGADSNSYYNIKRRLKAGELPLSVSFRCPTGPIELAQAIVPEIRARKGAPKGVIENVPLSSILTRVKSGDLIICRVTAPLISLCLELIRNRRPASVKGRNIGKLLTTIVNQVMELAKQRYGAPDYPRYKDEVFTKEFLQFLDIYFKQQREKLAQRKWSEGAIEALQDRIESIDVCYKTFQTRSPEELIREIDNLFSDENGGIVLSTVHKAKGLEAETIWILEPDKLPFIWANQQPWQTEQEYNLRYVALTRTKMNLFFLIKGVSTNEALY